jgi:hypothetical protein
MSGFSRAGSGSGRLQVGIATNEIRSPVHQTEIDPVRFQQLKKEFDQLDANRNGVLTYEEILSFLSSKSGKNFDENLLKNIFTLMDTDRNQAVTVEEFAYGYVNTENILKNDIAQAKRTIQETQIQIDEYKRKLIEAQSNEQINEDGIMIDSVLTVEVLEAQNLRVRGQKFSPSVRLKCDGKEVSTKAVPTAINPEWYESFTFPIKTRRSELLVEVVDAKKADEDNFLGQIVIPLNLLEDQMKHLQFFELRGKKGNESWQGRIRLSVQWIWSRVKYFEALIGQLQEVIDSTTPGLEGLNAQLKHLAEPFGAFSSPAWLKFDHPEIRKVEQAFSQRIEDVTQRTFGRKIRWELATLVSNSVLIILALLAMFERPDFVNLMIGIVGLIFFFNHTNSWLSYKWLAIAVLLSQLYDFVWMYNYLTVRFI